MRTDGRDLVETTFSLDIRPLVRGGAIRDGVHVEGEMRFPADDDDDEDDPRAIAFEVSTRDRANRWIRVRCTTINEWSGKRRVRELYLPSGGRYFLSRQAYDLAYETEHLDDRERAWRRVSKCRAQLDSDPDGLGEPYPEKPAGMSPARYARLLARLDAAENDLELPLTRGGPRFASLADVELAQCTMQGAYRRNPGTEASEGAALHRAGRKTCFKK